MEADRDVIGFAHGRDLLAFQNAAGVEDIRLGNVDGFLMEHIPEMILAVEALARSHGNHSMVAHPFEGVNVVRHGGFFDQHGMEGGQLAACTPNFLIHEIMFTDGSFRQSITNEEVVFEDGYILIPEKPGLGIEINEEEISKHPYKPRNLRHYTGTLTDIRPKDDTIYYFKGLEQYNEKH